MEVGFTQPPTHSFILGSIHARRAPLSLLPLASLFRMMELQGIRRISLAPFLDKLWGRCKDIQCCFCFTLASVLAKSYIRHANFYYDLLLAPIGPCWHWIAFGLLLALKNRTAFQFGHRAPKNGTAFQFGCRVQNGTTKLTMLAPVEYLRIPGIRLLSLPT